MKKCCALILGGECYNKENVLDFINDIDCDIICADGGLTFAYDVSLSPIAAIGDFDTYTGEVFPPEVIKLATNKDVTDSRAAIQFVIEKGYKSIFVFNSLGGRFDHTYANLLLLHEFNNLVDIRMFDCMNELYVIGVGEHSFENCKYISFFSLDNMSEIELRNFKYNLPRIKISDISQNCISNEVYENSKAIVYSGCLLVIKIK